MGEPVPVREQDVQQYDVHAALREVLPFFDRGCGEHFVPEGLPHIGYECPDQAFVIDNKDIALWHAKNDNPPMRVRHILEYIENGEMVGKDVLEYDVSTDKWHRVEEECIELV